MSILPRLLPRDESFFDLFTKVAHHGRDAAKHLEDLFSDRADRAYCIQSIKRIENEADQLTHEVVNRLNRTFITPIDREDIHLLAGDLDDVVDRIDGTARRAEIFRLGKAPEGVTQLCDVIRKITSEVAVAVANLAGKGDPLPHCMAAKRFEEEGDAIYHSALGRLFDTERDPIQLIKWKEIFDNLEATIDESEDVANDLEAIFIKNA